MRFSVGVLIFALAFGTLSCPALAKKGREKSTASKDTIEMVSAFLKIDTDKLPPGAIPQFLEIDYKTLPENLRDGYRAKRIELLAIKRMADGKKKPPLRRLGEEEVLECEERWGDMALVRSLKTLGFLEINEPELNFLIKKTKCTECELQLEFSLSVVYVRSRKKGKPPTRFLFLHTNDPITVYVTMYRSGNENVSGTNFFGVAPSGACR